jgi:hypothetical protein
MDFFRSILPVRAVIFMLSAEILNLSIDPPDLRPNHPEDLSVNDIESIAELVLENVFGVNNAVKEQEDHDAPDGNPFILKIDLYSAVCLKLQPRPYFSTVTKSYQELQKSVFKSLHSDIASPPPKA